MLLLLLLALCCSLHYSRLRAASVPGVCISQLRFVICKGVYWAKELAVHFTSFQFISRSVKGEFSSSVQTLSVAQYAPFAKMN